jgi:hypothetical protein
LKRLLTKLLLALSLVANPVAVLAGDFHGAEMEMHQASNNTSNRATGQDEVPGEQSPHDKTDCAMPCCEDSECSDQEHCIIQHSPAVVAKLALNNAPPLLDRGWGIFITEVPDRELPPESPPPIHI